MAVSFEILQAEALNLTPPERKRLLERLIASLDVDEEVELAWELEADRRESLLDSSAEAEVSGPKVLERLRARLAS